MPFGWVAAGSAALSAVGSIAGSGAQASGDNAAAQTQQNMFNTITQNEQPFMNAGYGATTGLQQLLGLESGTSNTGGLANGYLTQQFNPTMQQLQNYPGYQFQLQQGDLATQNAAAPGMGALSGAALKSLSSFNQGLAASNYNNYFNQFQTQQNNIFNRLSGLASLGQNAASNVGNNGAQLGTGIAQAQAAEGGAIGAGLAGVGNSLSQGYLLNGLMSGSNNASNASALATIGDPSAAGFGDA